MNWRAGRAGGFRRREAILELTLVAEREPKPRVLKRMDQLKVDDASPADLAAFRLLRGELHARENNPVEAIADFGAGLRSLKPGTARSRKIRQRIAELQECAYRLDDAAREYTLLLAEPEGEELARLEIRRRLAEVYLKMGRPARHSGSCPACSCEARPPSASI